MQTFGTQKNTSILKKLSTNFDVILISAAAIGSVTDIVYIVIYRDMSEVSRYCTCKYILTDHMFIAICNCLVIWLRLKNRQINRPFML